MGSIQAAGRRPGVVPAIGLAIALLVGACGPGASATTAPTAAAAASAPAASGPASTTSGTTEQVSANTASYDQIVAALIAAGVPNASRWANEVMEYRPYPADDATLQHLQDNLAKYNPDPATLAAILSALVP